MKRNGSAPALKNIRLELEPAFHARLRVLAAKSGLPMSKLARKIIEEKLSGKSPIRA